MSRRPLVTLGLLLLVAFSAAAADLPRWDDDSAVTVTPHPRAFAPALESANLVAQVFHPIDVRTDGQKGAVDANEISGEPLSTVTSTWPSLYLLGGYWVPPRYPV